MKKHLIALAALAASTAAFAQSSVTLYGNLDVSIGRDQVKPYGAKSTTVTNIESGRLTESYFGLRGTEDLGSGLKAVFKLESEIAVDSGAAVGGSSNFFGRNAYVGVAGDFGSVVAGRRESLLKDESGKFNPFRNSQYAFFGAGSDSWSNSLTYVSPNLSGLTIGVQTSLKEQNGSTAANYSSGGNALSVNYTNGPVAASLVYSDVRDTQGGATNAKDRGYLLGASYDLGVVKLFGQYGNEKTSYKNNVADQEKFRGFQLGVSVPVTANGAVLASYGNGKVTEDNQQGSDKVRQYSLGYEHNVSKRTGVYAAYTRSTYKEGINTNPSEKSSFNSLAVGLRHAF